MDIEITNFKVLFNRVQYIQALHEFESHKDETNTIPTTINIQPCDFATDAEIITIFSSLQQEDIDYTQFKTIHFLPLLNFAELFIVEALHTYIRTRFFTTSINTTAKSVLWLVQHKHMVSTDTFNKYLQAAADIFGTFVTNLQYSLITDNWLANFVTLRSHLRKTFQDKLDKEKWDFNKLCITCNTTVHFDGRGIHHYSLLRTGKNWECKECNPEFKIKWFPIPRYDIM